MYKVKLPKNTREQVHSRRIQGEIKAILRSGGKFCHGTRGKPGHSAHGDKYY